MDTSDTGRSSIWTATAEARSFPRLTRDIEVDVAIIGICGGRAVARASAGTFLKENLKVASYYVKDHINGGDVTQLSEVLRGEWRIVDLAGDKLAVYRDDAYQLHVVSPVCTHLKCIVHWNQAERRWDCPCHGSRFATDGAVLEGPPLAPLERRMMPPSATGTNDTWLS